MIAWLEKSVVDGPWHEEPPIPRVAVGVPNRVARLRGLGNAVVPQLPTIIGAWIREAFDL